MPSLLLAALSGVLTALCYPRPGLCWLGWFSLTPLFLACSGAKQPRGAGFLGFIAGFSFHAAAFHWIFSTCRFAGMDFFTSSLAWLLLAAALALNWAAALAWGHWAQRRASGFARPWLWALIWTAVAVFSERWTPRLASDLLEYTQYRFLPLIQIAALTGPHGLGFFLVALNAALAQAWGGLSERKKISPTPLALALGAWALIFLAGEARLPRAAAPAPAARVEILQPAVDQYRKWDRRFVADIFSNFEELLSASRKAPPDLIVWPESALPELVREDEALPLASEFGKKLRAWQLVGVVSQDREARLYSAAILLDADGKLSGSYHKRQLVPFGEFIPAGLSWLRAWIGILNELGGVTPGAPDQPLLETPLGLAAAGVCYEAAFPRWANFDARRGARLLINVTNDGWYKDTWGPYQHFDTNIFRAVENGVTVIRAGNTGISAVIDPWGRVMSRLDLNTRARLDAEVPREDPMPRRTFYARHGDWFGLACLAAAILFSILFYAA